MIAHKDRDWIAEQARAAGFELAGIAPVPDPDSEAAQTADQRFAEWIAAGHAGEMDYLKRANEAGELVRGELRRAMPWARSVVVCGLNYNAEAPRSIDPAPSDTGWIARYAWSGQKSSNSTEVTGSDYHDVLLPKLRQLESALREHFGQDCETR